MKVSSVDEASYYASFGARMVSVTKRMLADKKASKVGYPDQWVITMSDVPGFMVQAWKQGLAYGNITEYVNVRTKLKGKIKRELGIAR